MDPLSLIIATDTGKILLYARRYNEAIEWLRKVLVEDPNFGEAHYYLAQAYVNGGRAQLALAELDSFTDPGRLDWFSDVRVQVLASLGQREKAQRLAAEMERAGNGPILGYVALGESSKAIAGMEVGIRNRMCSTAIKVHPALDPLRRDPRFIQLLRQTGL